MNEEELKAKIAQLEADKAALVGETTDLRKSRADKEEELTLAKDALAASVAKNNENPEEAKISEVVNKILSQEKQGVVERNKAAAFNKFVTEHKEYHPDNDAGGIKQTALKEKFARFNTEGLVEVEDFQKVIGDAHALLRGFDTPRQTNTHVPSTPSSSGAPSSTEVSELSPLEEQVLERNGWTKEKYLALKEKMPDFVGEILANAR